MTMLPLSIENVEEGCKSTLSSRLESWTRRYLKVSLFVSLSEYACTRIRICDLAKFSEQQCFTIISQVIEVSYCD